MTDDRTILRGLFNAAVEAANPVKAVVRNLPPSPRGRTVVIAVGKAAVPMAKAVEDNWDGPLEGLVIAPHGYTHNLQRLRLIHGSHPVPDKTSLAAAEQALALASTLGPDDLLIALISGGASALMSKPVPGISIEEKFGLVKAVLKCGANIGELNGSGPTVADPTRKKDALAILARYGVPVPHAIEAWLKSPDEDRAIHSAHTETRVIVSPHESFRAVRSKAEAQGLNVLYLGDRIEGEAREVAKVHAAIALEIADRDAPVQKPCLLLSGGETGVTVRGKGRGGRNVEFLLALAIALGGDKRITALAADTDGIDGMEQIAGAVIDPPSLDRARALGLDPMTFLENNDAHSLFERLGDQVVTGPTHTNVNDFRGILIR